MARRCGAPPQQDAAGARRDASAQAMVPHPRPVAGAQIGYRARAVSDAARPVLIAGRHGVLRSDVDLFRGERTARDGRSWPQPRRQAAQPAGPGRSGHGRRLADRASCLPGNWRDAKTVPEVLSDLEQRFGLKRVVFVGDRGMVTSDNLDLLRGHGHGYIVGRNRRRSGEVFDYIQSATGPWIECPVGITAREKAAPPKTRVQEVASKTPGVRVFVVHSEEREAFERSQRVRAMERVRTRLEKLARRIAKGRLKAAEKIGAAAARILTRNHGHRYYEWTYQDGVFRFFEHPVHFTREQAYEGKYVIQTEEPTLSAVDAVRLYKELSDVERAFANLKDVLDMRPIYHRTDGRVDAHIYVAALAFLLHPQSKRSSKPHASTSPPPMH